MTVQLHSDNTVILKSVIPDNSAILKPVIPAQAGIQNRIYQEYLKIAAQFL
ncbi:Uncharacterised protein [Neisseria meningitidis]|nr:Uncharacterised protein [Neisseria meningitidis]